MAQQEKQSISVHSRLPVERWLADSGSGSRGHATLRTGSAGGLCGLGRPHLLTVDFLRLDYE